MDNRSNVRAERVASAEAKVKALGVPYKVFNGGHHYQINTDIVLDGRHYLNVEINYWPAREKIYLPSLKKSLQGFDTLKQLIGA